MLSRTRNDRSMIKNFLNWIKNLFSPKKEEEVVELTNKQQKILKKYKGDLK